MSAHAASPIVLADGADAALAADAGADDTSRREVAEMEAGAVPSAVVEQARKQLADRHEAGMVACGDSRQDAGLDLWLSLCVVSFRGYYPGPHCCLSVSDCLFLRAFFLPSRSVDLPAMVAGADRVRGAGIFLFDGPR